MIGPVAELLSDNVNVGIVMRADSYAHRHHEFTDIVLLLEETRHL